MKSVIGAVVIGGAAASNPLGQVLSLMDDLAAKVTKEGEAEAKAYKDYFEWCDDVTKNTGFALKTAASQKESLEANIAEMKANIEAADSKISDLATSISTGSSDLAAATKVRETEVADFTSSEKELVDVLDTLGRATTTLQREMQKNPAALAQVGNKGFANVVASLSTLVDAASFSSKDAQRLTALVQSTQNADEDDGEFGAPSAAEYKGHSTGILDVLADLTEKAETQLSTLRNAEGSAAHNYAMLKQSLEDQLAADTKAMADTKSNKAASSETKSVSEGDLAVTIADIKSGDDALATSQSNCMTMAADHQGTVAARTEELKVIAQASSILKETTSGAVGQTYSFIQQASASGIRTDADLARSEVVTLVKKLARQQHDPALAQLASRIKAVMSFGASSSDPFGKVKAMIGDMIKKLEDSASTDATEKAYCDEEMSKTGQKKMELDYDIEKLTTKIDQASSRGTQLKAEVKELQAELANMAHEQAEAQSMRNDENSQYRTATSDLNAGLNGVRKALSVLRDYYAKGAAAAAASAASLAQEDQPAPPLPAAHSAAGGAGDSIIGILEVVESDFAQNLAKEETQESDAQSAFETDTQMYKIGKTSKGQDVKYKTQEFTGLDKSIAALSQDRDTENVELSAVIEYYGKLKQRCIAKPESYSERVKRREAEITGLKDALQILENESAFVQRGGKRHRHMRGALQL